MGVLLAVLTGLAVNEFCEVSPWAARNLIRWSARHRYDDRARAAVRAEELAGLIDDRPGKLFKLITALGFVAVAIAAEARRAAVRHGSGKLAKGWRDFCDDVWRRPHSIADELVSWCILPSFVYPLLLLPGISKVVVAYVAFFAWMTRARAKHLIARRRGQPEVVRRASKPEVIACVYAVIPLLTLAAGYDVFCDIRAFVLGHASASVWFGLIFSLLFVPFPWMTMHMTRVSYRASLAKPAARAGNS